MNTDPPTIFELGLHSPWWWAVSGELQHVQDAWANGAVYHVTASLKKRFWRQPREIVATALREGTVGPIVLNIFNC